jgi:hypothetical protein
MRASYPFECSGCDKKFPSIICYNNHVRNPSIRPPAMQVASLNSNPFVRDDKWTHLYRSYFDMWQRIPISTKYWLYCAIAVPKNVYEATETFDMRQYMRKCIQERTPVTVYIGKYSGITTKMSRYHLEATRCSRSSIGKSILSKEFEWFHVTSQQYRNHQELNIAEVLAQTFVNWRCHHAKTRSSGILYKPLWSHCERQTFQNLTSRQQKLGLLRLFKDADQFQLFCTRGLMGTCNINHDEPIEVIKGQSPINLLFSGNWHITEENLTPLKIRNVACVGSSASRTVNQRTIYTIDSTPNEGQKPKVKRKPCTPSTCPVCAKQLRSKNTATTHFMKCHPKEYNLRKHNE